MTTAFSGWYKTKLGQWPILVQGLLWFAYGFVWIPVWYLITRDNVNTSESPSVVQGGVVTSELILPPPPLSGKTVLWTTATGLVLGWGFGDGQAQSLVRSGVTSALGLVPVFRVTGVLVGAMATLVFVGACWKLGLRRRHFAQVGYWKLIVVGLACGALAAQAGLAAGLAADLGMAAVTWSMLGMFIGLYAPGLVWARRRAGKRATAHH